MISKDAFKKITAARTEIDSFKATLDALVEDQTLAENVAGLVKLALDHGNEGGELEKALRANVVA